MVASRHLVLGRVGQANTLWALHAAIATSLRSRPPSDRRLCTAGTSLPCRAEQFDSDEPNLEFVYPCSIYTVVNGVKEEIELASIPVSWAGAPVGCCRRALSPRCCRGSRQGVTPVCRMALRAWAGLVAPAFMNQCALAGAQQGAGI